MDEYLQRHDSVDLEVRAYVYSLVSALGGTGADDDGRYVLGDDALACLKDLKRWLKLYDERLNRLDVARCLAEANLVKGDLLEILGQWPDEGPSSRMQWKIALADLELLVPLTWPIETNELTANENHYRNTPYLQLAQTNYKRDVLEHWSNDILHAVIRIALPALDLPIAERTPRDEGIIKLALYFFRNLVIISGPPGRSTVEWNEEEVSRSATIEAFHKQDVLALLLTIASNMGEDFNTQDVVVLEILFHLIKGVEVEKLFMEDVQIDARSASDLRGLMNKEKAMLSGYSKDRPSRHNRFGTMIWVERDDEKVSSVSGQFALHGEQETLRKMDSSKKWSRPQRHRKEDPSYNDFEEVTPLTKTARAHLRTFVQDFLDSGFNPLMHHLRKAIEREAERVLDSHYQQYFYVVGWFLEAERARREASKRPAGPSRDLEDTIELGSSSVIASVLNQETFILLNRYMQERLDVKLWHELNAGMRCFTQILLTIQDMAASSADEDQEIAENIQNRIFYEESTHDRIISILRGYKDQGFSYLDACTELAHVFLRMLERYSKENIDLQIRSRRRARKKKQKAVGMPAAVPENDKQDADAAAEHDSEAEEDVAELEQTSRERKFDFKRFSARFVNQNTVDTFVAFVSYFHDLTPEQLKRAHRFFYRTAFKQELSVLLFRVDIISLFQRMIKGPEGLAHSLPLYKEWDELVKQIFRRMVKKMQERPELAVELLFSKIPSTAFYLEYGYEKQTRQTKPKAPTELEVRGDLSIAEQLGVLVAVLHSDHMDILLWLESTLEEAARERQSWNDLEDATSEAANELGTNTASNSGEEPETAVANISAMPQHSPIVVNLDDDDLKKMRNDARVILLLKLAGFERPGDAEDRTRPWNIPSHLSANDLRATRSVLEESRYQPQFLWGAEKDVQASDMLQTVTTVAASEQHAEFDDDSDADSEDFGNEEFNFPVSGPTARKSDALKELKKRRRKTRQPTAELSDDFLEARRVARRHAELEKMRKIKSTEFVIDSDDDEDPEREAAFFAREAQTRRDQSSKIKDLLRAETERLTHGSTKKRKRQPDTNTSPKRRRGAESAESRDMGSDPQDLASIGEVLSSSSRASTPVQTDEERDDDTPISSPPPSRQQKSKAAQHSHVRGRKTNSTDATLISSRPDSRGSLISDASDLDEDLGYPGPQVTLDSMESAIQKGPGGIDVRPDEDMSDDGRPEPASTVGRRQRGRAVVFDDSDED